MSFIKEHYPDGKNENSNLEFLENELYMYNENSESKINYSKFDKIIELKDYIFIRIGPTCVIIPIYKLENPNEIRTYLNSLAKKLSKEYITNHNWKWK